jgi:phosphoribosylaminoimidazole-succinocarboxamide synthase
MTTKMLDVTGFERIGGGKTKDILLDRSLPGYVLVRSRDDISAGDGARKDVMTGKAELANTTTVNNFSYLDSCGIWNHFVSGAIDPVTFRALQCTPIPIECVARRYSAGGSFPLRVTGIPVGHRYDHPVVEMFWKQDVGEYTDPFMVFDAKKGVFELHPAKEPTTAENILSTIVLSEIPGFEGFADPLELIATMEMMTEKAFLALESAYAQVGLTVVDFKIEFGMDSSGLVTIIDVIDADSWRAWIDGDPEKAVDKQYFRDHPDEPADTSLPAFRYVAEKSAQILELY